MHLKMDATPQIPLDQSLTLTCQESPDEVTECYGRDTSVTWFQNVFYEDVTD